MSSKLHLIRLVSLTVGSETVQYGIARWWTANVVDIWAAGIHCQRGQLAAVSFAVMLLQWL